MSLSSRGKHDETKPDNKSQKHRVPNKKITTTVGKTNKYNKLFKKRLMGKKEPILHTIPEVSFIESTTPPKQNTFVVADWTDILGEDESSANLKHRKAVALAKVNARHVVESWNNHLNPNSPRLSSDQSLSLSPKLSSPLSTRLAKSSSPSLSSSIQLQGPKYCQDSKMQRQNENVRHYIHAKDEGVKSDRGEQIHFDWDSSTTVSQHQHNLQHLSHHIPSAINKLYQAKHRKRLQAKKKLVDGVGSKSAPTSDSIPRRSSSSSGKRRRKMVTSSKEKMKNVSTAKMSKNVLEPVPKPPKEAFIVDHNSISKLSKNSLNVSSNSLAHAPHDGHTESDKENRVNYSKTSDMTAGQHHQNTQSKDSDSIDELSFKSTKIVSFADTQHSSPNSITSSFSQNMAQTYLDIHRHIKKHNVETRSNMLPCIVDDPKSSSQPPTTTTVPTMKITTAVKQKNLCAKPTTDKSPSNNVQCPSNGEDSNKSKTIIAKDNMENCNMNQIYKPTTVTSISTSKFITKSSTNVSPCVPKTLYHETMGEKAIKSKTASDRSPPAADGENDNAGNYHTKTNQIKAAHRSSYPHQPHSRHQNHCNKQHEINHNDSTDARETTVDNPHLTKDNNRVTLPSVSQHPTAPLTSTSETVPRQAQSTTHFSQDLNLLNEADANSGFPATLKTNGMSPKTSQGLSQVLQNGKENEVVINISSRKKLQKSSPNYKDDDDENKGHYSGRDSSVGDNCAINITETKLSEKTFDKKETHKASHKPDIENKEGDVLDNNLFKNPEQDKIQNEEPLPQRLTRKLQLPQLKNEQKEHQRPPSQQQSKTQTSKPKYKGKDKNNNTKKDTSLSPITSCNSITSSSVEHRKLINAKNDKTTLCENVLKPMADNNTISDIHSRTKKTLSLNKKQNYETSLITIPITSDKSQATTKTTTNATTTTPTTNTAIFSSNNSTGTTETTKDNVTTHQVTTSVTNNANTATITSTTFTTTTNAIPVEKSIQQLEKDERKPALADHQATANKRQGCRNQLDSSLYQHRDLYTKRPICHTATNSNTTHSNPVKSDCKKDIDHINSNNTATTETATINTSTCTSTFTTTILTTTPALAATSATSTVITNNNLIITPSLAINDSGYNTNETDKINDRDTDSTISPRLVNQINTVRLMDSVGNRVKSDDNVDGVNIESSKALKNTERRSQISVKTKQGILSKKSSDDRAWKDSSLRFQSKEDGTTCNDIFRDKIFSKECDVNSDKESGANVDDGSHDNRIIKGRAINEEKGEKPVFVVGCLGNGNNKEKCKGEKRHANRPLEKEGREAEVLGLHNSQTIRDRVVRIDKSEDGDIRGTNRGVGDESGDSDEPLWRDSSKEENSYELETATEKHNIGVCVDDTLSNLLECDSSGDYNYHYEKRNNSRSDVGLNSFHGVVEANRESIHEDRETNALQKKLKTYLEVKTNDSIQSGKDCVMKFNEERFQNAMDYESKNNCNMLNASFRNNKGSLSVDKLGREYEIEQNEKRIFGNNGGNVKLESDETFIHNTNVKGIKTNTRNSEIEFYKDVISGGEVFTNNLKNIKVDENICMVRRQTVENLSLESNFQNTVENGVQPSGKDNGNVIYTKAVMVRPKTAGMSKYSKDKTLDNKNKEDSRCDDDDDSQYFTSSYLNNNTYINDQWWTNNNYVNEDDDIKFINTDADYYEVFGYDDETRKILEATRVYPLKKNGQSEPKRKSKATPSEPTTSSVVSHALKRSTIKNMKPEHDKIRTISDSNLRSGHLRRVVPKLDLNLSPERKPEVNKDITKKKREGQVNLSNEEKESKSKQDISDMVARCESDDSIYRNQQHSKFPQGKVTHKIQSHFSNRTIQVKNDSIALTPRITNSSCSSSSSFNTVTSQYISTSSKLPTVKQTRTLKSINNSSNSEINHQTLDSKKNKNVGRSRKQSYNTLEEETPGDLSSKKNTDIFGDIYKDSRVIVVPSSLAANQPSISYKSFTKAKRRIRSEADINSETLQDQKEFELHEQTGFNKTKGVDCASTATGTTYHDSNNTEDKTIATINSHLQPNLNRNFPTDSSVSNKDDKHGDKKNIQDRELKQKSRIEDKQTKSYTTSLNSVQDIQQSIFVQRDDKKRHLRDMGSGSHPILYDTNVELASSKFNIKDLGAGEHENDVNDGNTRLSQSFNGRENKDIHSIPLSLSLPKQSRLLKDESQISKAGLLRSNKKTMLTPLITGNQRETSRITQMNGPVPPAKPRKLKPIIHHSGAQKQKHGLTSGL